MDSNAETVTLEAFADRVGCHFTTASRLRSGERKPSSVLLGRIVEEYGLDKEEAFDLFTQKDNASEFGAYLRRVVFDANSDEPGSTEETGNKTHDASTRSPAA
ncbi:helix-turn-helix DNA binding domain protein [Streptomyces phage Keanu]|nr:helix-turn-helix DNA binding domain protein [Streptomyces phage Keanu]